ncbi:hypothetical protein Fmac_012612 [Flemingia macrophylla]|uniref:Uncharacterized protein n=1 Tax=Flemingia macrophylla TaxID=520843 RepID=A0ABD1MQT2_9FABA
MDLQLSSREIGDSPKKCEEHLKLESILLGSQESESVKVASEKGRHNTENMTRLSVCKSLRSIHDSTSIQQDNLAILRIQQVRIDSINSTVFIADKLSQKYFWTIYYMICMCIGIQIKE